ncbi:hypothetical protein Q1695_011769 [Nippostrongylus brasiliensis]|nr:hypothetical protein Q1695_011769 [Nippostrongylus brasiliensis]
MRLVTLAPLALALTLQCFPTPVTAYISRTPKAQADRIVNLPGVTFALNFEQFSGYLPTSTEYGNADLFYWSIESQNNATTDPLILFINGDLGCSSTGSLFEEIGPFRIYQSQDVVNENVFSWNKVANLLVIDMPYTGLTPDPPWAMNDDDKVVSTLLSALDQFFIAYPERLVNQFYVAGEGYGSVYATRIAYHFMQQLTLGKATANLQGVIIENGLLSVKTEFNTILPIYYTHGYAGKDQWNDLRSVCCRNQSTMSCDFYDSTEPGCKPKAEAAVSSWLNTYIHPFDMNQDCYSSFSLVSSARTAFGLQADVSYNYASTDPWKGFPCNADTLTRRYVNDYNTQQALHANPTIFVPCWNEPVKNVQWTTDLTLDLSNIVNHALYKSRNISILLYNGDLDTVHNFLSAQNFIRDFATAQKMTVVTEDAWRANYNRDVYQDMDGGLHTIYSGNVHVVTVRGAGHKVPRTRPAQTLQVVRNFLNGLSYNNCLRVVDLSAKPLLANYSYLNPPTKRKQADLVTNLPGLTFEPSFKQYSGYLRGSDTHQLHYWLVEAATDPSNAPLLLWLNGGPGSSSVWGMLTENGPFRPNRDGKTLYENIYSWNRFANVLYLEAPHNVGYSYSTVPDDNAYNDDQTADENYNALKDFFSVFTEYTDRPFFVTGESYGGVYIPTLSRRLLQGIFTEDLKINFTGIAIGNGELTTKHQVNSVIFQLYTYGLLGRSEYDALTSKCCPSVIDTTTCDFYTPYIYFDYLGNYKAKDGADPWCAQQILSIVNDQVWNSLNDPYNIYQDCYQSTPDGSIGSAPASVSPYVNFVSSDALDGFPCWCDSAATVYMNQPDVRQALHIPDSVQPWLTFNAVMNSQYYNRSYFELDGELKFILTNFVYKTTNMRTLIYNGDADQVCNHLGDQWFIEELAANISLETHSFRRAWYYQTNATYQTQLAGFQKVFTNNLYLVTVKGSGHLVPMDRPAPALQMIYNFVHDQYIGTPLLLPVTPTPLKPEYSGLGNCAETAYPAPSAMPAIPAVTIPAMEAELAVEDEVLLNTDPSNLTNKALADMITSLPGLTFNVTYRQFSGYLTSTVYPKNHLFYWFVESQNDPVNDPVVLWLNGGPGCSSIGGFFEELGPFHNNPDGQTLFENVYAWNKMANVLFLEAPVGVGFSYTDDTTYKWSDDTTADNNAQAIKYFFDEVFPNYKNNEFFVTGESYAGVYGPTLSERLVKMIDAGTLVLNFKGMAIGNGILSEYLQTDSMIPLMYGRGFTGLDDWQSLENACTEGNSNPVYYDYSNTTNLICAGASRAQLSKFDEEVRTFRGDPYSIYQDCYLTPRTFGSESRKLQRIRNQALERRRSTVLVDDVTTSQAQPLFSDNNANSWYGSTDAFHGFPCFNDDAMPTYLNRPDVMEAIHAKLPHRRQWSDCSNLAYAQQRKYFDMSSTIHAIMSSATYTSNNMRLMFYNGDVDTVCQFLGDQWFIEAFVAERNLSVLYDRQPWNYQSAPQFLPTLAGYAKAWSQNVVQLTVKGSGHFVPMDRPAQALQMIVNFVKDQSNYSTPIFYVDTTPKPLLNGGTSTPTAGTQNCSRKESDRIITMPGLNVSLTFKQYSGFLKGSDTHMLHYWLAEAEMLDPASAPLLLWLNGGPGSSSLEGLFFENGPFRISKDGQMVYKNPYAWNQFANVLYLESPVGVGYSYSTDGKLPQYSDDLTAAENFAALVDFFNLYPEYRTRPFYTTGESYAGVYIPTLSALLIQAIQAGTLNINYKGLAMGNGVWNKKTDMNSLFHLSYYHGQMTHQVYQTVVSLCCGDVADEMDCRLDSHITSWNSMILGGDPNDKCYVYMVQQGMNILLKEFDPYNLYEQCYTLKASNLTAPVGESWTGLNYDSSDPFAGYYCYMNDALSVYMNKDSVRKALHIPSTAGTWQADSDYYTASNFTMLLYSGDVDTMCNWMGAEWFTTQYFNGSLSLGLPQRQPWYYYSDPTSEYLPTVAGYSRQYKKNIDVLTMRVRV